VGRRLVEETRKNPRREAISKRCMGTDTTKITWGLRGSGNGNSVLTDRSRNKGWPWPVDLESEAVKKLEDRIYGEELLRLGDLTRAW